MKAEAPAPVAAVALLMERYTGSWSLCGGWAIDAWLGGVTREHGDVDIAVFLDEQHLFYVQLADWQLVAHETEEADHEIPWDGHSLAAASHLHAGIVPRRELLINERDAANGGEGTWQLRRFNGATATLPLPRFALKGPWGVPTMAPEALLFYKVTGERRPHDEQDIASLMPVIDAQQRSWLADVRRR